MPSRSCFIYGVAFLEKKKEEGEAYWLEVRLRLNLVATSK